MFFLKNSAAIVTASLLSFFAAAESVSVNVFAVPSQHIEKMVAQVSDNLKAHGMSSFYQQGFPLHITLYLTEYDETDIPTVLDNVKSLASQQSPVPLNTSGVSVTAGNWVFVDTEISPELQGLADIVTLTLAPLRNTAVPLPGWVAAYPNKLTAFERYGSPNVFQNFEPHMTLLAAAESEALQTVVEKMKMQPPHAEGQITAIGVGLADENGQVSKVLQLFSLMP